MTRALRAALAATLTTLCLAPAHAGDPAPPPVFSTPTAITNVYAPFVPDSTKLFRGRSEGARTAVLESHLEATRTFLWHGEPVETRILEEKEFERGVLVEIARTYLAQSDDGSVWAFGEVSVEYEDGEDVGPEEDAWLLGGPSLPSDPLDVLSVAEPSLYMPATLSVGQSFSRENFPGGSETIEVVAVGVKLKVPAGKFTQAVRLRETTTKDEPTTHSWVVPGLGEVRERGKGGKNQLIARSLQESAAAPLDD